FTLKKAGFNSIEDLKSREVVLGAHRVGHRSYLNGRLTAEILGLKVRWVLGYTTPELYIAMERREIDGRYNDAASVMRDRPDWFDNGDVIAHVSNTLPELLPAVDHPVFSSTPSLMQFAETEVHRDIVRKLNTTDRLGGAFAFPPGTPDHIRKIVEKAFLQMGKDPKFQHAWETEVGIKPFQGVFSAAKVEEAIQIYTDWKPDVLKAYRRLGYQAPK
ncbi:MAG: hypothetical protein GTO40_01895, partial [Deltaproteobacteria bacterium]|nr:hypothetical protein [Deltaproteobacteria bacterium]